MIALCLLSCLAAPLATQSQPASDPPFKAVAASFFAVSVENLATSTQWYSEKLGLSVVMQVPPQGGAAVTVLESGGLIVELVQLSEASPRPAPATTRPELFHGIFKVGFAVKNLDRTVDQLKERGVAIVLGPYPATDTQRANLVIKDNSGNLIQLFGE